jgi:hypothetical protein
MKRTARGHLGHRRTDVKNALALFVVAGVAAAASAEVAQFGGRIFIDARTGVQSTAPSGTELGTTVYDNTGNAANAAFSSTNLANVWGDDFITTGTGTVDEFSFAVFNSGSSAGALLTATAQVLFWDDTLAVSPFSPAGFQGGFNGNINFGAGLNPGFYSIVTFTGLSGLGINLLDTYNVFTQQITAKTGAANRLGIASLGTPTIGSGFSDFYQNPGSAGEGWYTSGTTVVNLANKTVVIPAPGALAMLGLGGLVAGRRRR